ncbi:hypothetical protein R6Q59_015954 [Mikania micrantha]
MCWDYGIYQVVPEAQKNGLAGRSNDLKLYSFDVSALIGGDWGNRYAQYGEVSPKVDVYAFGVVLYELISAKKAIIRANDAAGEPKGLISSFDEFLSQANPKDELVKMIDPRMGDNYPLDSVMKMAQLAKSCTNVDPQQRPSMRSIVNIVCTNGNIYVLWKH